MASQGQPWQPRASWRRAADALAGLEPGLDPLRVAARLRGNLGPLARRAAELYDARRRARGRFPGAETGFFTGKGAEQMSRAAVAEARAARISERLGSAAVLDATCGMGADSAALARAGHRVVSMDRDPTSALCASENLSVRSLPARVLVGDACRPPLGILPERWVVVLDPDRRPDGRREAAPERWSPPLASALALAARHRGACLKLAPSLDPERIAPALDSLRAADGAPLPWSLEWVEVDGELCELALWTGALARRPPGARAAVALEADPSGTLKGVYELVGERLDAPCLPEEAARSVRWLARPSPAVVRSRLIGLLARETGMATLGPGIAWLGGPEAPRSPFLRSSRVLDSSTVDRRRVRAMLARHGIGPVTVWKRGHPDRPETLERRLGGSGERRGLLAVVRLERGHAAYLLDPAEAGGASGSGPVVGDERFELPPSSL